MVGAVRGWPAARPIRAATASRLDRAARHGVIAEQVEPALAAHPGCTVRWLDAEATTAVCSDLMLATYPLLTALSAGPATASEVAAAVGVDRTVVTKQATALQEAGLVDRRRHPHRPRATLLTLTPAGREVATAMRAAALDVVRDLRHDGLTDADLAGATRVLHSLARAAGPQRG